MISHTNAKVNAESMYNTETVRSGLITGTQWDVMINQIADMDSSKLLINSTTWGNYANSAPKINIGRLAKGFSSSGWYLAPFEEIKYSTSEKEEFKLLGTQNKVGWLWTTGASDETRAYNLYDVAGNVWEWTEESISSGTYKGNPVMRGGGHVDSGINLPVCYRFGTHGAIRRAFDIGFRVVLYIK